MNRDIKINKKRLLATIIICLFSIISISSWKIFINHLNNKNNIIIEEELLYSINIEQESPAYQHQKWLQVANNHRIDFLKFNSINNTEIKNIEISKTNDNLFTVSLSTILANLMSFIKAQIKDYTINK